MKILSFTILCLFLFIGCTQLKEWGEAASPATQPSTQPNVQEQMKEARRGVIRLVGDVVNAFLPGTGLALTTLLTFVGAASGVVIDYKNYRDSQPKKAGEKKLPYDWSLVISRAIIGALTGGSLGVSASVLG